MIERITDERFGEIVIRPYRGDLTQTEMATVHGRVDSYVIPDELALVRIADLEAANNRIA